MFKITGRESIKTPIANEKDLDFYLKRDFYEKSFGVVNSLKNKVRSQIYTVLQRKTGNLAAAITPFRDWTSGNTLSAGLSFGEISGLSSGANPSGNATPYIRTHIRFPGFGKSQFIKMKDKFLTVPVIDGPAYRSTRPHKTAADFGHLDFIPKGKIGNRYALLVLPYSKRKGNKRSLKGNVVFSLRPSVRIPRRLDAMDWQNELRANLDALAQESSRRIISRWVRGTLK